MTKQLSWLDGEIVWQNPVLFVLFFKTEIHKNEKEENVLIYKYIYKYIHTV